jgi:eukaryotic-like serine/threonine-protein kinase
LHSLAHPNIVRGHSFQSIGSCVFIVMDLVPGHSLDRMVRHGGPLSPRAAANATIQAARGLDCAHRASIVHRDVKPSNLLVDRSGRVKVIDFGMARLGWPGEDSITLVHDETLLGTVNFMAPEQAMDCHEVDGRADIYALGCTLYFLLTGRPPFSEGSVAVRLMKHREEAPQPLCSVDPDIPRPLALICERMMAKAPSDRYRSAGAVADELVGWILAPGDRGQSRAG